MSFVSAYFMLLLRCPCYDTTGDLRVKRPCMILFSAVSADPSFVFPLSNLLYIGGFEALNANYCTGTLFFLGSTPLPKSTGNATYVQQHFPLIRLLIAKNLIYF